LLVLVSGSEQELVLASALAQEQARELALVLAAGLVLV
jgi:hypothetical protein